MPDAVLRAIRSQPWAIMPDWLAAIERIAERALDAPELMALLKSDHASRYGAAMAVMGQRLEGTRRATFRGGVASLPLFGPIFPRADLFTELSGATSLDTLAEDLRAVQANEAVEKILLVVDSPGGVVFGVDEFASLVAGSPKPITVHGTGMIASAAYWIGSQASEIVIDTTGMLGSIGVVMSAAVQEAPDANGNRRLDIVSSNAANKRPDLSTDEGRARVRADLDAIEEIFIGAVAKGRKVTKAAVVRDFGEGGVKVGKAAVQAGMADRIDSLEGTLSRLARGRGSTRASRRALAAHDLDVRRRGA